jgi:peptide/nickel transport system permease protein
MDTIVARVVLNRILFFIPSLFLLALIVFVMGRLTGDPVSVAMGDRLSEPELQAIRAEFGYDLPITTQFANYLIGLFGGDLGKSFVSGLPVLETIGEYLPASVELGLTGLLLAIAIAYPCGIFLAKQPGKLVDVAVRSLAIATYALPVFLLALGLRLVFSFWIPLFPTTGRLDPISLVKIEQLQSPTGFYLIDAFSSGGIGTWLAAVSHLVLPSLTIGLVVAANLMRVVRANYIFASRSQAVEFAKTLGLKEKSISGWHISKLAAPQIITSFGSSFAAVITGVVFVEVSFEWRGLGWLLADAVLKRDFELIQGLVLFLAIVILAVNLIVDLVLILSDRRFRTVISS